MDRQISSEKAIRELVKSNVITFAQTFSERHISEFDNPDGTLNMKIHNVFIAALGILVQIMFVGVLFHCQCSRT